MFARLYVEVGILLFSTCMTYHFTKRRCVGPTQPLFIEVAVSSQEILRSCIRVLRVSIWSLSTILIFDFLTVEYFLLFILMSFHYP
jgi:hypothetical protein